MTTRLILTRHGQTTANVQRRYAGHTDAPLTKLGLREARALARRLRDEQIDAVYASDLLRAAETARIAAGVRETAIVLEPRLRELSFGAWEGLTFDEVKEGWPDDHHLLSAIGSDFHAPGGEPFVQSRQRIVSVVEEIVAANKDKSVLVVCHAGTVAVILQYLLGITDGALFRLATANCSLTYVEYNEDRAYITRVNDTAHLERLNRNREGWR